MAMQKTGDWKRVEKMLSEAGKRLKTEVTRATDENGRLIEATMVGRIEQQKLSPPLSPRYLKRKIREGYSEQILIRTGTLLSNIRYEREAWDKGFVGISRNVRTKSGDSLVNIAAVHEFGAPSRGIPARPYVAPTQKETAAKVPKRYEEAIERVFKR